MDDASQGVTELVNSALRCSLSERLLRLIMPIGAVLGPLPLASLLLSMVFPCGWGSRTSHIPRGGLLLGGGVPNLLGTSVRGKTQGEAVGGGISNSPLFCVH